MLLIIAWFIAVMIKLCKVHYEEFLSIVIATMVIEAAGSLELLLLSTCVERRASLVLFFTTGSCVVSCESNFEIFFCVVQVWDSALSDCPWLTDWIDWLGQSCISAGSSFTLTLVHSLRV
jgi:hypothetical protein